MRLLKLRRPAFVLLCTAIFFVPAAGAIAPARSPIPVSGRVLGPGSKPLQDARVALVPVASMADDSRLGLEGKAHLEPVASAATGADGSFRLEAPEPGMWKVRVEARGLVPREMDLAPLLEETALPAVEMEADAKLEVRVTSPKGAALPGARVRISTEIDLSSMMSMFKDGWSVPDRIARTDANGVAVLPRAAGEKLLVEAGVEGQPVAVAQGVRNGSVTLRLSAGTLRPIRIVDAGGKKPVGNVYVHAGEQHWCLGRTSEDGLFAVPVPRDRKVQIFLLTEDGRYREATLDPLTREAKTREAKEPRTLRLPGRESVTGRVVSAVDGRPVAGALVWNMDPGAFQRAGVDGVYRIDLWPGLPNVVRAAAPGFLPSMPGFNNSSLDRAPTVALVPALTAGGVVVDEKGAPVADVEVEVLARSVSRRTMSLGNGENSGRTQASGRFRIGRLEAGTVHELRFSKDGFAPASAELPPLEPGRPVPDLRIVLRKGRTGFGRVVNRAEEPVVGAEVVLRRGSDSDPRAFLLQALDEEASGREAITGTEGRFEIHDLPAGTYELAVKGRGYAPLGVPGLAIPEGAGSTDLGTLILVPGIAVEGHVVDAQGQPIAGAEVILSVSSEFMPVFLREGGASPAAVTGADGFFRIEDRAAGETIDLLARRTGYAVAAAPGIQLPAEKPVRLVLTPALAVEGRAVDPDGRPVPGAMVFILPDDMMSMAAMSGMAQPMEAVADTDGLFRIEGVPPGSIELHAVALGRQQATLKNLEVRPGQDLTGLEVVLAAGAIVEGRILSSSGQPVVGAEVELVEEKMSFGGVSSDGDGHYRLEGVAPGMRTVLVSHQSYRSIQRQVEVREGSNALDLTLEAGSSRISGRVVDQGGASIANARVYLYGDFVFGGDAPPTGVSGPDGSFTLSGISDGTYRIFASKAGFARSREGKTVVVADGGSVEGVEIRLSTGGSIAGRILGLDFTQLSQVTVELAFGDQAGQVRPDGSYRIDHVEPGEVRVVASLAGGARQAEGKVVLEPGVAEARLDLEFGKGFILTGRVLLNGEPRRGERLVVLSKTGSSPRWGTTDQEGRFRFDGLAAGDYMLNLIGRNMGRQEEITLTEDRDILIELRTASISGRVVDAAARRPLANATLLVAPSEASADAEGQGRAQDYTTTDSRGVFVLRDVAEGSWKVEASLSGYAPAEAEVQVVAGTPVEGVELALQPVEGLTLEVLLPSGSPPAAMGVWVLDTAGRLVSSATWPVGEGGRVQITGIEAGTWELVLDVPGSPLVSVPVTVPGHSRVVLPQSSGLELFVVPLHNDGKRGKLRLTDESGRLFRRPTAGGVLSDFVLEAGEGKFDRIPAGVWTITVTSDDGRTWSSNIVFPPGKPAQVVLTDE
jgi:hypothetical protein